MSAFVWFLPLHTSTEWVLLTSFQGEDAQNRAIDFIHENAKRNDISKMRYALRDNCIEVLDPSLSNPVDTRPMTLWARLCDGAGVL